MIELTANGRFPKDTPCDVGELVGSIKCSGDEVTVRLDSNQYPEFWIEMRVRKDLLQALLNENQSDER